MLSAATASATAWFGVLVALWSLLAPRQAGDLAGAIAVVLVFGAAGIAWAAWQWRRQRLQVAARSLVAGRATAAARSRPSTRTPASGATLPLDGGAVLEAARARFLHLQAAWDAGDVQTLGRYTTPEMLQELLAMLASRAAGPSRTDVVTLHAELLDLEELGAAWLASVEFSGLIRECADGAAVPFRELWMLAAPKDGAMAWRLARQQALL